jgi:uncharacterized protein YndB with AHSA1/START domain/ketosteroid isomerase-like protein
VSAPGNRELIERLYGAMDRGDGEAMAACYRPDARFHDPAFGELTGEQAGDMWRMLTSRATDLEVDLREHDADEATGRAHWVARYTFTATGRPVVNDIQARFRFRDGRIAEHLDRFSFWRWSRQALGPAGLLLGWTPLLRAATRRRARGELERFSGARRPDELTLEMKRVLGAVPSVVFRAFTDSSELAKWWGPEGFTIPSVEFQPRVGGSYRIEMQPPEGDSFYLTGEFREVDPPARLAYTFVWEDPDPDDVETLVVLSFRDLGESTEVAFAQGAFKTEGRRALHRGGWTDSFDKLERLISAQA